MSLVTMNKKVPWQYAAQYRNHVETRFRQDAIIPKREANYCRFRLVVHGHQVIKLKNL